ncbi:two-component response regulator-like APRR2 isoform X2 [Wolffia australiana]
MDEVSVSDSDRGKDEQVEWRDFPKGIRVLLLLERGSSSSDIKSLLERMQYSVSVFEDEEEALEAVRGTAESFHVAIVEVTDYNSDGCFRFLETAKGLPTIMISDAECIETTMRCIALGAVEFLRKPVSEEKLKNIWQHVVHQAFNAGGGAIPNSLKPVKETVSSMLQLEPGEDGDRLPAPATPQLEQFSRSPPLDPSKACSSGNKYADETCNHSSTGEEDDGEKEISAPPPGSRPTKRRTKVDWTPDLHKRFVQAVEQLGIDLAIPSKILELMRVEGLTRHNVASHLQKYRMRKRHALPKDEGNRVSWQRHGNHVPPSAVMARSCHYRPVMAFAAAGGYPVWGHPHASIQPWAAAATFSHWHPPPDPHWPWKSHTRMHADAWGCPVLHHGSYPSTPIHTQDFGSYYAGPAQFTEPKKLDGGLTEEVIDEVVRQALTEPWRPLPLGLKPPSTESVLSELHRQGISRVPPR